MRGTKTAQPPNYNTRNLLPLELYNKLSLPKLNPKLPLVSLKLAYYALNSRNISSKWPDSGTVVAPSKIFRFATANCIASCNWSAGYNRNWDSFPTLPSYLHSFIRSFVRLLSNLRPIEVVNHSNCTTLDREPPFRVANRSPNSPITYNDKNQRPQAGQQQFKTNTVDLFEHWRGLL